MLYAFSVCWLAGGNAQKKSKTATIIKPKTISGNKKWLESNAVKNNKGFVILYKRVSHDFKTQENTKNETVWKIGATLEHPSWNPRREEWGSGKFHACSRAYFCDEFEFRSKEDDKYIAIKINVKDLYAWRGKEVVFPQKIAFRKGKVLYVCDRMGKKLSS
jgi:hypothetical protein